jgi:hypothetical protein
LSLGSGFRKPILGGWRERNGTNNMVDTPVSEDSKNLAQTIMRYVNGEHYCTTEKD